MGFTITTWLPLFLTIITLVEGKNVSMAKIFFTPPPKGRPPVYVLDKSAMMHEDLIVTCDGTGNGIRGVVDIILRVKKKGRTLASGVLSNRDALFSGDNLDAGFSGTFLEEVLNYTMSNVSCAHDGLVFECTVAAVPNLNPVTVTKTLALSAQNSVARISPPSDTEVIRAEGDVVTITCFAAVAIKSSTKEGDNPVTWRWQEKDKGDVRFKELAEKKKPGIDNFPVKLGVCRGGNTSTQLLLTIQLDDKGRTYRCIYKNSDSGNRYDDVLSAKFEIGSVRKRSDQTFESEKAKVVYTMSSLIGMILGLFSFISVSCLGIFYIYRKNRGGKKYNIVKTLLEQEEEELDKIEATLGMAAGQGGVDTNAEESSANESSIVESEASSLGPSAAATSSAAPESTVGEATSTAG